MVQSGKGPHALDGSYEEPGQCGWVLFGGDFPVRLSSLQGLYKDAFDRPLIPAEEGRDFLIPGTELQVGAQQETSTLVLLPALPAQVEKQFAESFSDRLLSDEKLSQHRVVAVAIVSERFQIERSLVPKSVVETLASHTHLPHQRIQRRVLVSKTPENVYRRFQRLFGFELLCTCHMWTVRSRIALRNQAGNALAPKGFKMPGVSLPAPIVSAGRQLAVRPSPATD
jgi:hypothetical protein